MLEQGFKEMLEFAVDTMQISNKNKDKILDFGCGNGRFTDELRRLGFLAYGCDIAPKSRSKLFLERQGVSEKEQYIRYYRNGEQIPFENGVFSYVFSYQVFEHLKNLDFSTKELNRVLESCGGGGGLIA
ncbi:MAG: class I SAM-dependent methyltransferase [Helicobacteraceae bacterium]|nr:class I SAM-dependent methyltransferase [Helicobacteraceae bacterium]